MTGTHTFLPDITLERTWWDTVAIRVRDRNVQLALESDGDAVVAVAFGSNLPAPTDRRARTHDPAVLAPARLQLEAYAAGELERFDLALRPTGTDFQLLVWEALTAIPFGHTVSYGALASAMGRPGAARAIGGAVGANPIAIVIPCHRVIGADGSLTGFGGGIDTKVSLLALEGVATP